MLMTIGEKITFFRKRLRISQEEMAERLDMTPQGYGKIERDETDVPYSRLELICSKLGTTLQDLAAYGEKSINNNTNSLIGNNSPYQIYSDALLAQDNQSLKEKIILLEGKIKDLEEIIRLMNKS
jgi:transcriptional regulator with XRE-family HTH domain